MRPRTRRAARLAYLAVLVVGFALYKVFGDDIRSYLMAADAPGARAAMMPHVVGVATLFAAFTVSVFFSIPLGPLFYIVFGYYYGPYEGTIVACVANTAGSVGAFYFFRSAMPPRDRCRRTAGANVFVTLLLLRSSPWIPNPLITLFCGAFDIGIVTFTLTSFLGTMPLIAVYTLAASRLRGHLDLSVLYSTETAVAFGLLSAVSLLGLLKPLRIVLDDLKTIQAAKAGGTGPS